MKSRGWTYTACFYLGACLLLGGASAAGALVNAILQVAAVGIIVALLWRRDFDFPRGARPLIWIGLAFVLVAALTLVPLPPSMWAGLPFRGTVAEGYRLLGAEPPALPVSLSEPGTVASMLHILPPAAMYLLTLQLTLDERRQLPLVLIGIACVSIVLGAFQLMGGDDSMLRPYVITNADSPVGFFANINHEATLLLCALPFVADLAARAAARRSRSKRSSGAIVSIAVGIFIATGIAISGSSAGYGLFLPAAMASALIYIRATRGRIGWAWGGAMAVFLVLFTVFALRGPLSTQNFEAELTEDSSSRRTLSATSVEAVKDSFPVGTGLGTFSTVYRAYENPNRVNREYANHVHNDYIEYVFELGLAGLLLILAFIGWWGRTLFKVWRREFRGAGLARAGTVVIGVVLLHSIVDYPLRTAAIAAVVALACALNVPPVRRRSSADEAAADSEPGENLRHLEAA
ncbi:MAG TPA: O-antigen ligase family protein [Allosphingosinicella sp.]|jgi:O-antigen ligase